VVTRPEDLKAMAYDPALDILLWSFPHDPEIAFLPALTQGCEEIRRLLPGNWAQTTLVAYAPTRAAVMACVDPSGNRIAYAKIYHRDRAQATCRIHESLARQTPRSPLRIPRPLACSPRHRMLIVEPMEGTRLLELAHSGLEAGMGGLGAAVAVLHRSRVDDLAPCSLHTPDWLRSTAVTLAGARPDLEEAAARVVSELVAHPPAEEAPACLHGDLTLRNAILGEACVALIDLDGVSAGPAAADLGTLLGYLRRRRLSHKLSEDRERRLAAALLESYGEWRRVPSAEVLGWHTAAGLLGEVGKAVRRVNDAKFGFLSLVLDEAAKVASGDA
jgi:Ser/Thr protein kinase RdoA (MazF antagonist)